MRISRDMPHRDRVGSRMLTGLSVSAFLAFGLFLLVQRVAMLRSGPAFSGGLPDLPGFSGDASFPAILLLAAAAWAVALGLAAPASPLAWVSLSLWLYPPLVVVALVTNANLATGDGAVYRAGEGRDTAVLTSLLLAAVTCWVTARWHRADALQSEEE